MDYKVQNRAAREEGIKEGIEKGREEEKFEIAKNMLKNGLGIDLIRSVTELSIERIKELQKEIDEKAN